MIVDYAYVHARPNGSIFYVGKGRGDRYKVYKSRNAHHKHIVNKYGSSNILVGRIECSTHDIALELEKGIIKCLGRMGVELSNITEGGMGALGRPVSASTRQKLHEAFKGKHLRKTPISVVERTRLADLNRARRIHPETAKEITQAMVGMTRNEKISYRANLDIAARRERVLGEKNPMYGRSHTEEYKARLSEAMAGVGNPFYGKTHTDKAKRKMADTRAKMLHVKCPHCDKVGHPLGMKRWHFEHCRSKT